MPIPKTLLLSAAVTFVLGLGTAAHAPKPGRPGYLLIANQYEHTALLLDLRTTNVLSRIEVGVNGHEVAVAPDGHFGYIPIYGNSGVGKPGTDGTHLVVVDLATRTVTGQVDFGKGVRPHCPMIGPKDGLLYVSTELNQSISGACETNRGPQWATGRGLHPGDSVERAVALYGEPNSRSPSTKNGQPLELLYCAFDWAGPDVPQVMEVVCTVPKDRTRGRVVEITLAAGSL